MVSFEETSEVTLLTEQFENEMQHGRAKDRNDMLD